MNTQINTILPDIHLVHDIPKTTSKDARMIEMQAQLLIRQDQLIGNMMKLQIKGTLVTPDEKVHIRMLFSKGLSKAEIGRRTGRGRDTVRSIIKASPQVH